MVDLAEVIDMGDESEGPPNIPQELVIEILCKLPVKTLIRFTCVCKSWLGLIRNDHQFAMKHYLTRTTSSSIVVDNVDYMFDVEKSSKPCLYSLTGAKTFRLLKKFECVPDTSIEVANSCHGIICFQFCLRPEILLCNPSIQEVILLPPCPISGNKALGFDPISGNKALGFDPINNDYKVVAITCPRIDNHLCTVNVYSVRCGHWRNLHVSASLLCIFSLERYPASNANGRMCNWLFNKRVDSIRTVKALLSFDMVEEVLKELPMPESLLPQTHQLQLLSSSRWQACLTCFPRRWDFSGGFIDVWVLKGSGKSDDCEDCRWSKEFAVKCPDHELMPPLNFWINDKELFVNIQKGNIIEVFHYDLDTQQLKRTGRKGSLSCLAGYVESLVSIKRFMSLHYECKHGEDDKQNDDQDKSFKQEDNGGYVFREVNRKGVQWFQSVKLIDASK